MVNSAVEHLNYIITTHSFTAKCPHVIPESLAGLQDILVAWGKSFDF